MRVKTAAAAFTGLLLITCVVPAISQTRSAPATRSSTSTPGRFQVVMQPSTDSVLGLVYLVDTATGRVWAHIHITPSDEEVDAAVENMPLNNPQALAAREAARKRFIEGYGPCHGTARCFVEIDRVDLTDRGWVSSTVNNE